MMTEVICYPKSKQPEALSDVGSAWGSSMGRRDITEARLYFEGVIHLTLMKMVDFCYDTGGAYWGAPSAKHGWMYRAWYYGEVAGDLQHIEMFVRGVTRRAAKLKVLERFPKARFYK